MKRLKHFIHVFYKDQRLPLGRWHNSGEYFHEKFLKLKEDQKKEREIMRRYNLDPYFLQKNKEQKV